MSTRTMQMWAVMSSSGELRDPRCDLFQNKDKALRARLATETVVPVTLTWEVPDAK